MFIAEIVRKYVQIDKVDLFIGSFLIGLVISMITGLIILMMIGKIKKESLPLIILTMTLASIALSFLSYVLFDKSNIIDKKPQYDVEFTSKPYTIEKYKNINGEEKYVMKDRNDHMITDKIAQRVSFAYDVETTNDLKKGDKVIVKIKGITITNSKWKPKKSYDVDEVLELPGENIKIFIEKTE